MAGYHFLFVALLSVVAIAIAEEHGDHGETPDWAYCCIPDDKFMVLKAGIVASSPYGLFGKLLGESKGVFELHQTYYDYENMRFAARVERQLQSDPRAPVENIMIMEEAEDPYVWVIDMTNQKCMQGRREEYPFRMERCIPTSMEMRGTAFLGDMELHVTGYETYIPPPAYTFGHYAVAVTDECKPYLERYVGVSESWGMKQEVALNMQYYNYTVVTEDMMDMNGMPMDMDSMFEVPDFCFRQGGGGRWWQ